MPKEIRTICYDPELNVEAYRFEGIMQKFPNHFHDYYAIGFIERGSRYLTCKNRAYIVRPGDIVLFNPGDNHTCEQIARQPLDYRCMNIKPDAMKKIAGEITGKEYLPYFTPNLLLNSELAPSLRDLHSMILKEEKEFAKEENLLLFIEQLISECCEIAPRLPHETVSVQTRTICAYLEQNYMNAISLDELIAITGVSKYDLLRSFTRQRGISPYRYLETIRVHEAKKLLERGVPPADAAFQAGFCDQSHFTNFFKRFIGVTPKQYMRIFEKDRVFLSGGTS